MSHIEYLPPFAQTVLPKTSLNQCKMLFVE